MGRRVLVCLLAIYSTLHSATAQIEKESFAKINCTHDGFLPHPTNCKAFYWCSMRRTVRAIILECDDNQIFDTESNTCRFPWESTREECGGTYHLLNEVESIEYSHRAAFRTIGHHCVKAGFFHDENDCMKYYRCVLDASGHFIRYEFNCAPGTVWDQEITACNYPWATENFKCGGSIQGAYDNAVNVPSPRNRPPPNYPLYPGLKPEQIEQTNPQNQPIDNNNNDNLDSLEDECYQDGFMDDSYDCQKFYRCVEDENGNFLKYEFTCVVGTVWDSDIEGCNYPSMTKNTNCGGGELDISLEHKIESNSNKTNSELDPDNPNVYDNFPVDSTNQQPYSSSSRPIIDQPIANNTKPHHHVENHEPISDCNIVHVLQSNTTDKNNSTEPSSLLIPSSTTEQSATENPNKFQLKVECIEENFIPDPQNCKKFYRCVSNGNRGFIKYEFTCGNGTVWDADTNTCNHPSNTKNKCIDQSSIETIDTDEKIPDFTSPTTSTETIFSENPLIEIEEPSTSTASNSEQSLTETSSITSQSVTTNSEQSDTSTSKPNKEQTTSENTDKKQEFDICTQDGFIGDPKDCKKFYRCVSNGKRGFIKYEFACGDGTVWDTHESTCNYPHATKGKCGKISPSPPVDEGDGDDDDDDDNGNVPSTEKPSIESSSSQTTEDNKSDSTPYVEESFPSGSSSPVPVSSEGTTQSSSPTHEIQTQQSTESTSSNSINAPNESTTESSSSSASTSTTTPSVDIESKPDETPNGVITPTPEIDISLQKQEDNCVQEGFIADSKDCKKFYRCVSNGKRGFIKYEFACGDGTVWDTHESTCNYPHSTKGKCGNLPIDEGDGDDGDDGSGDTTSNKKPSSTESSSSQTTETIPKSTTVTQQQSTQPTTSSSSTNTNTPPVNTESKPEVNLPSESSSSEPNSFEITSEAITSSTVHEIDNSPVPTSTETSQTIDTITQSTTVAQTQQQSTEPTSSSSTNVPNDSTTESSGSSSSPITETPPVNTGSKPTQENDSSQKPKDNCTEEGFIADLNDCKKFYRCVSNGKGGFIKYEFSCGEGTVWDVELLTCNYPKATNEQCGDIYTELIDVNDKEDNKPLSSQTTQQSTDSTENPSSEQTQEPTEVANETTVGQTEQSGTTVEQEISTIDINEPESTTTQQINESGSSIPEQTDSTTTISEPESSTTQEAITTVEISEPGPSTPEQTDSITTISDSGSHATQSPINPIEIDEPSITKQTIVPTATTESELSETTTTTTEVEQTTTVVNEQSSAATDLNEIGSSSEPSPAESTKPNQPETSSTTAPPPNKGGSTTQNTCAQEGFFPNLNDCNKFYRCVSNGQGFTKYDFACSPGTIWDPNLSTCNHAYAVTNKICEQSSQQTTEKTEIENPQTISTSTETEKPQIATEEDRCTGEGFQPSSHDCKKFFRCVENGNGGYSKYDFICGEGTIFDPSIQTCNYPYATENVACGHLGHRKTTTDMGTNIELETTTIQLETTTVIDEGITGTPTEVDGQTTEVSSQTTTEELQTSTVLDVETTTQDLQTTTISEQGTTEVEKEITATTPFISTTEPEQQTDTTLSQETTPVPTTTEAEQQTVTTTELEQQTDTTLSQETTPVPTTTEAEQQTVTTVSQETTPVLTTTEAEQQTTTLVYQETTPMPTTTEAEQQTVTTVSQETTPVLTTTEAEQQTVTTVSQETTPVPTTTEAEQQTVTTVSQETTPVPTTTEAEQQTVTTVSQETTPVPTITEAEQQTTTLVYQETTPILTTTESEPQTTVETETDSTTNQVETTTSEIQSTTNPAETTTQADQETTTDTIVTTTNLEQSTDVTTQEGENTTTETIELTTNSGQLTTDSTEATTGPTTITEESTTIKEEITTATSEPTTIDSTVLTTEPGSSTTNMEHLVSSPKPAFNQSVTCPISEIEGDQIALVCPTGFKRHPKYCNLFYQCSNDPDSMKIDILVFSCPSGTIYDDEKIQCLAPEKSSQKCTEKIKEMNELRNLNSRSVFPMVIDSQKPLCSSKGTYPLVPFNKCMNSYIKCQPHQSGKQAMWGYIHQCPDGYTFWPISKKCEKKSPGLGCIEDDTSVDVKSDSRNQIKK